MTEEYIRVCRLDDLQEARTRVFEIGGKQLLVAREKDQVYIIDNTCTHDNGIIGDGKVIQGEVQCPRHGARFDIKTGRAMQLPAIMDIKTYKTMVVNGDVMVSLKRY
nr:non-heme iron oxygenase ferredoxin subunit [candidate division Zixibacteria bacterium]